jgi:hypothetical protein
MCGSWFLHDLICCAAGTGCRSQSMVACRCQQHGAFVRLKMHWWVFFWELSRSARYNLSLGVWGCSDLLCSQLCSCAAVFEILQGSWLVGIVIERGGRPSTPVHEGHTCCATYRCQGMLMVAFWCFVLLCLAGCSQQQSNSHCILSHKRSGPKVCSMACGAAVVVACENNVCDCVHA